MISKCIYKVLFSSDRSINVGDKIRRTKSPVDISSVGLGLGLLLLRSKSLCKAKPYLINSMISQKIV